MGGSDLKVRTKEYALSVIRLFAALPKRTESQILGRQLLRSGTSVGAQRRHEPNPTPISLVKLKDRCRSWRKQSTGWNCLAKPDFFRTTDWLRSEKKRAN